MNTKQRPWLVFDQLFDALASSCAREARSFYRFKPFVRAKTSSMHNITHMDIDDCVQIVMGILYRGCEAFYRTQKEELQKYVSPTCGKTKRESRAQMTTFMYRHIQNKYNSFMTSFFLESRAFESCRLQVLETEGGDGHEGQKFAVGTRLLTRTDVTATDGSVDQMYDWGLMARTDFRAVVNEFYEKKRDVVDLILDESVLEVDERVKWEARAVGLSTQNFISAVRGLFGNSTLSNTASPA